MVATVLGNSEPPLSPTGAWKKMSAAADKQGSPCFSTAGVEKHPIESGFADLWYTAAGVRVYPT